MTDNRGAGPAIAIVGGGCSGVLVAAHLLDLHPGADLTIVEPRAELGRGVAYSTPWPQHLLNVTAGQMSAFTARPAHLVEWLAGEDRPESDQAFVPRQQYGRYLQHVLDDARARARARGGGRVSHLRAEVVDADVMPDGVVLSASDGTRIQAALAVLALGNPPPAAVPGLSTGDPRVFASAWDPGALSLRSSDERVLLVGTGLTAVDALLAFEAQGHTGALHLLSRRGRLPQGHVPQAAAPSAPAAQPPSTLRGAYRAARAQMSGPAGWRAAIDGLRPVTNALWQSWSQADRSRFLRHVKAHWDTHRHRMAPEIRAALERGLASGRLSVHAGRLRGLTPAADGLRIDLVTRAQQPDHFDVDRVINCTGIAERYDGSRRPLIGALLAKRLASTNAMGTGFAADADGALVGGGGRVSERLFTIGPPRYGELLETIAVPEIRMQAERLAVRLVHALRRLDPVAAAVP